MSTVWSNYTGGIAVGINVTQSPSTVSSSTASVTLTWTVYARNAPYYTTGSYTWSTSGAKSASGSGSGPYLTENGATGQTWEVTSFTTTVSPSYTGSVSSTLHAALNWTSTGAAPSLSRTVSVAKRPPAKPSGPTKVSAAISGSNVAVSWTRPSNASSAGTVWSNAVVQRQVDTYSTTGWKTVATLAGTATSWTDTSTPGNHQYFYRVYATNSAGGSPTATSSGWLPTAPAAPTGVTAQRSGANIVITWADKSPYNSSWKIEDSPDGTTWSTVTTLASATATSYTHTSPSTSVTHRYRITAITPNGLSAVSAVSNTVTLLSAPSAPSNLAPAVLPVGGPGTLTWTHNPTDTSAQTAFEILYSVDGGATWTDTGKITSTTSSWDATPVDGTAQSVQWQVCTWGAYANAGPYSAINTTVVATAPTVTITNPTPGTPVDTSSVWVQWNYASADGSVMASYAVVISDTAGNVVASQSAAGQFSGWWTPNVLQDATNYTVSVTLTSQAGMSTTVVQPFSVSYDTPVAPTVTLDDQIWDGYLTINVSTTSNGTDPDTVRLMIERQIEDGDWLTVWEDSVTEVSWRDYGCSLTGLNTYRVTATSALPSSSQTVTTYQSTALRNRNVIIVATGAGLGDVLRFSNAMTADLTAGRSVTLNQFAGRAYPVATLGQALSCAVSVTAQLVLDSDDLEAERTNLQSYFVGDGPFMYRDSLGRRFYCSLSSVVIPSAFPTQVTFTATQVDPGVGVVEGTTA